MVMRNSITKRDGNVSSFTKKPRKFLFKLGEYDVSFHRQRNTSRYKYYHMAVWHRTSKIGSIDLSTKYTDIKSIVSVSTHLSQGHQGKGIAHSIYENLAVKHNITIYSDNQSLGAVKLWRKIAMNKALRIYFIDTGYEFFKTNVFEITINADGKLQGIDYKGNSFDPYRKQGGLILVRKKSPIDNMIQNYIPMRRVQQQLANRFARYDAWKDI